MQAFIANITIFVYLWKNTNVDLFQMLSRYLQQNQAVRLFYFQLYYVRKQSAVHFDEQTLR